jgi:hypothetical protein
MSLISKSAGVLANHSLKRRNTQKVERKAAVVHPRHLAKYS